MRLVRYSRLLPLILCFLALPPTVAQELEKQRLLLTFIPNVQFAPFYVGLADGVFAEAGFDLTLEHLQEPEVVDLVAAGQADFGIVSGEQVILARSRDRDIVYIFEWFQRYPVGIIARGTDSLADLRGRKVGLPGRFGASYTGLTALLGSAEMTEADIEINEIGFNAPEVFCLGAVDAAVVYINNEPIQIRDRGRDGQCDAADTTVFAVGDFVDLVSNGLITRADLLDSESDSPARMAEALSISLQTTIDNPARAYFASLEYVDSLPADESLLERLREISTRQERFLETQPTREAIAESRRQMLRDLTQGLDVAAAELIQFEILLLSIELWDAARLGYSEFESWRAMRDTLAAMGILDDAEFDLQAAFSNDLLPGVDA